MGVLKVVLTNYPIEIKPLKLLLCLKADNSRITRVNSLVRSV